MIVINEKEYLNLQEQVWKNTETIRCLLSGLKITGTGPTFPLDPEDGEAFLLQLNGKTYLGIYFEADQAWTNLGEFPAVGPQGIPGPQGSAATIGAVECSTRTISAGDSASVEASVDGTNLHFDFEIPQGAIGAQGPRGERGPQGLTGETGPRGPQGETGSSISIVGTLTSSSNLPDPETVPATTAYIVGLTAPYNLYVIVGAAGSRLWKDVGAVTPQNITVDASMSGSSQNPVQNRVVKSYVDAVKTTAEAAYTRSTSNLGRINTIQNVDLPNIYYELADLKEIVFETVAAVAAYVVDPAAFFVTPSYITIDNVAYPVIDDTDAEVAEILGSTIVSDGNLVDFVMNSITSRGFNQWNEEWEVGALNSDGTLDTNTGRRTTSFIEIRQNMTIYQDSPGSAYGGRIAFFDANKNVVLYDADGITSANKTYQAPQDAYFVRITFGATYGITYNDDICINVSNASLNGKYKPYRESSIDWESVIPNDEGRTARSAGTVRDVIYVRDDGNDTFSVVKRKTIGKYTFTGNEGFSELITNVFDVSLSSVLSNAKTYQPTETPNMIMADYTAKNANSLNDDYQMTSYSNTLRFVNSSYHNNIAGFKESMAGKAIEYELATPQETVLASGLLYDQVSFLIERGGTIAINGGMPDALPGVEIDIPVKRFNE